MFFSLMDWPPTPDSCSLCLSIYQDAISKRRKRWLQQLADAITKRRKCWLQQLALSFTSFDSIPIFYFSQLHFFGIDDKDCIIIAVLHCPLIGKFHRCIMPLFHCFTSPCMFRFLLLMSSLTYTLVQPSHFFNCRFIWLILAFKQKKRFSSFLGSKVYIAQSLGNVFQFFKV
jgi:hypothetical protein